MDPNNLVAGMAAGVFTAMVLHPIDLVKVRLQVQDGRTRAVQYRGIKHAVTTIWQQEGARGFYRGVVPACWGSGGSWGFYFLFYEACKRRLLEKQSAETGSGSTPRLSAMQHVYAAWEGGTLTCLLTNPMWLIKTRMQLQGQGPNASGAVAATSPSAPAAPGAAASTVRPYSGVINAVQSIVREEGFLGLYRGLLPALLLVSHGMIQFGVYEEAKQLMPAAAALFSGGGGVPETRSTGLRRGTDVGVEPAKVSPGFASAYLFAAAGASKALATTATYPYQVIKARLQQRFADVSHREYTGFADAVRKIWRHEGGRGFYKGFGANILRVAPQSAITISCYEAVKGLMDAAFPPAPVGDSTGRR